MVEGLELMLQFESILHRIEKLEFIQEFLGPEYEYLSVELASVKKEVQHAYAELLWKGEV